MLQATEYDIKAYLKWLHRTVDFSSVMNRRGLDKTPIAKLFVSFLSIGMAVQLIAGVIVAVLAFLAKDAQFALLAACILVSTPAVWAYIVTIPTYVAKHTIINPKLEDQRQKTHQILSKHPAIKIAVAGSYGKTTMKELLNTVLSEGKKVAVTPANKNVASSHYQFAKSLAGDEDVLVIEFGEGKPGDVLQFTKTTSPDVGIITGLAPAHLDQYGSIEAAAGDIFSLAKSLSPSDVYVNIESANLRPFLKPGYHTFDARGIDDWKSRDIESSMEGTRFLMEKPGTSVNLQSGLLGKHLVGVLSATVAIANRIGLSKSQIEAGISKTVPFEHRMQPYKLAGAWVIDDAYNGNIQGVKAGTELLASLTAKRKIYVTPGLVDQGSETQSIHVEMGRLIAAAHPEVVVLMRNSVTESIQRGLTEGKFEGKVMVQTDPLTFYLNLDKFVAHGDILMLQNDWTDNYQ